MNVKPWHPHKAAVRVVTPHTAVVSHAWIPAHGHELAPGRSNCNVHRAGVSIAFWNGIPACVLGCTIFHKCAGCQVENRSISLIHKVAYSPCGASKFENIETLICERHRNDFACIGINLVATLIEGCPGYRHLLTLGHILPGIHLRICAIHRRLG